MNRISPEYLELQRQLHAGGDYGNGVNVEEALQLIAANASGGATVLDYGAGRGHLARAAMGLFAINEYDPAVPGKDGEPESAEIVCCLDVLEHVEEDKLRAVLEHIAGLTQFVAIFAISTVPAQKVLADGRNAHITLHDAEWWRDKIGEVLVPLSFDVRPRDVIITARPKTTTELDGKLYTEVGHIKAHCAVDNDVRNQQAAANSARIKKRLIQDGDQAALPVHNRGAVLACYGPSLVDTWQQIHLDTVADDVDVFTVSAAHRFMTERGVIPLAHMECDPRPHKATQMGEPVAGVQYWLASCVSAKLLDKLEGFDVSLWHAYNGLSSHAFLRALEPNQRIVVGGGSIGLRAMSVLYYLGYRRFRIHGMDCSFRGEAQHAGEHHGKRQGVIRVMVNGREFDTSPALATYYRYFFKQIEAMHDAEIEMFGDGMLQHATRTA